MLYDPVKVQKMMFNGSKHQDYLFNSKVDKLKSLKGSHGIYAASVAQTLKEVVKRNPRTILNLYSKYLSKQEKRLD